jgi:hypothetical protein
MCFVEGIIGVPAVATINWDDPYIHSSEDDLYQVDQTQLHRNEFLMGATAFVLSFATDKQVPLLASETFAQGERRLSNDLQMAVRALNDSAVTMDNGWKDASLLIEQGIQREVRALNSLQVFIGNNSAAAQTVELLKSGMKEKENALMTVLGSYYKQLHGSAPSFSAADSLEMVASRKIPANIASLKSYFDNRGNANFRGSLHNLMRDEVFNFVDGKKSYYDIYKAVRAEQLAGGSWYYGNVTLQDVVGVLDAAVDAKALTLK